MPNYQGRKAECWARWDKVIYIVASFKIININED